jgi:hypothetical protein
MCRNQSSIAFRAVNMYMKFHVIYMITILIFKLFDCCKIRLFRSVIENIATGQNEAMINGTEYTVYEEIVRAEVT